MMRAAKGREGHTRPRPEAAAVGPAGMPAVPDSVWGRPFDSLRSLRKCSKPAFLFGWKPTSGLGDRPRWGPCRVPTRSLHTELSLLRDLVTRFPRKP